MAQRGRPFERGNNFGRGRPRGSRNKRTLKAQELLNNHAESLLRKGIMESLKGDNVLLGKLLPYLLSPPREAPLKIGSLPLETTADLSRASGKVLEKVTSGDLSVKEGQALVGLIEARRESITENLERRVEALENENRRDQE